jgi:uncharacterized membrane protein (DUF4010 family)
MPALLVGAGSGLVAIAAAALEGQLGGAGIVLVSSASGFIDAHATTGSVATLYHGGKLPDATAAMAIVCALTTNAVTKIVMASITGLRAYALRVALGVSISVGAAWAGLLWL